MRQLSYCAALDTDDLPSPAASIPARHPSVSAAGRTVSAQLPTLLALALGSLLLFQYCYKIGAAVRRRL